MIMPNNFVLGSDKLFGTKAPWKINDSLLGRLDIDHYIATFRLTDDDYLGQCDYINRGVSKVLKDNSFEHQVFIGYGDECVFAPLLYAKYGIKFDTVFLVNNIHQQEAFDPLLGFAAVYNIYTKANLAGKRLPWAEHNQYIKTIQPAYMSNRVALEICGLLMYDRYNLNFLSGNRSTLVEI